MDARFPGHSFLSIHGKWRAVASTSGHSSSPSSASGADDTYRHLFYGHLPTDLMTPKGGEGDVAKYDYTRFKAFIQNTKISPLPSNILSQQSIQHPNHFKMISCSGGFRSPPPPHVVFGGVYLFDLNFFVI